MDNPAQGKNLPKYREKTVLKNQDGKERLFERKQVQKLPGSSANPNRAEVSEVLGISRAAAYELVRSKGFPHMKIGTRILVPRDKFIAWIDEQTQNED